jgi:hypothetical protein
MKVKLLKKLRRIGRDKVNVRSITTTNGVVTGMTIGYDEDEYSGIFSLGDDEATVKEKASRIYLEINIKMIREKYKKYGRKNSLLSRGRN